MITYTAYPLYHKQDTLKIDNSYSTSDSFTQRFNNGDLIDFNGDDRALYYFNNTDALCESDNDFNILLPIPNDLKNLLSKEMLIFNAEDESTLLENINDSDFYESLNNAIQSSSNFEAIAKSRPIGTSIQRHFDSYSERRSHFTNDQLFCKSNRRRLAISTYHVALINKVFSNDSILEDAASLKALDSSKLREAKIAKILQQASSVYVYDSSNNTVVEFGFNVEEMKIEQHETYSLIDFILKLI